jgi:hypothetical protein
MWKDCGTIPEVKVLVLQSKRLYLFHYFQRPSSKDSGIFDDGTIVRYEHRLCNIFFNKSAGQVILVMKF